MAELFDVVIIGGGPGGYAAALYGGAAGLKVAIVEKDKVGGTCLHRGCIPAKELLETAHVFRAVGAAGDFGILTEAPTLDWAVSQKRKQKVVDGLWKGLQNLLKSRKVTVINGTGTLHADRIVGVDDGSELRGDHIILAAGSVPRTIPGFEIDGETILTSDEVLALGRLPASAAVIGGGAIGCEFASMMADLGVKVSVLELLPRLLPGCDDDVVEVVARSFRRRGIDVRTGISVQGHHREDGLTVIDLADGDPVRVEVVVVSVGRRPASQGLLADGTGVRVDPRGFVEIDPWCSTGVDGVWAVGDLVDTPALAHVGFAEAMLVIRQVLGEPASPIDYGRVPWCIYCRPEVAFAGMTERAARDAGHDVVTSKMPFSHMGRAQIVGETEGLVKVIAERGDDGRAGRILGVHMAGPWVTEQLGQGYLSVNWEATPDEIAQFIQPHPTLSETFGEVVLTLTGRGLHG